MITLSDIFFFSLYVFAVGYVVKILLIDHLGPFADLDGFGASNSELPKRGVTDGQYLYPIDLFDRVKKFLGFYYVNEHGHWQPWSTVLWTCPWCLSFWVNLLGLIVLYRFDIYELRYLIVMILSVPFLIGFAFSLIPSDDIE